MMSQEEIQKAVEGVMALRPAGTKPRTKKKKKKKTTHYHHHLQGY
ncbi:hypothetical protein [Vibrio vulnificus]|nr:hypothetical protein [Vibrio vulnificus]MDK2688372.1 hypothetical protein [Vibrio vulnificus]